MHSDFKEVGETKESYHMQWVSNMTSVKPSEETYQQKFKTVCLFIGGCGPSPIHQREAILDKSILGVPFSHLGGTTPLIDVAS